MLITEKKLVFCSLGLCIIGLITLFFAKEALEARPISYAEFLQEDEGVRVVYEGRVIESKHFGNMTRISMASECVIPLIIFEDITPQGNIQVIGEKKYYAGKPEIVVEKIIEK